MIDSCSIEDSPLISIERALQKIETAILPIKGNESVVLKDALGRISSKPIFSAIDIPSDKNSAMDGYAFSSHCIKPDQGFILTLVGTSWAGKPFKGDLKLGECIRIFTGAVIPDSADSVIMQEHINSDGNKITFPATTKPTQYVRQIGSDIKKHNELLPANKKLTAIDIGLLATTGIFDVVVKRKLNIAFFSTGDELCSTGQILNPGQIYDSNRYSLHGLLNDPAYNVVDLGVITDDKQRLEAALLSASKTNDVIITTGGASVGEADFIKEILDKCGQANFWKIAIKPGKPLAFGEISGCYFFGLPGNPVSVIATFHKIVMPALQNLSGIAVKKPLQIQAICTSSLKKQKGRQEYQRGILTQPESGEFFVESAGKQGSHIMSAMSRANCYIVLSADCVGVSTDQTVTVEPFETLI